MLNPARRLVLSQTITGFTPPSKESGEAFEPHGGNHAGTARVTFEHT